MLPICLSRRASVSPGIALPHAREKVGQTALNGLAVSRTAADRLARSEAGEVVGHRRRRQTTDRWSNRSCA
jgi:hypothetical protein